ncbi:putative cysteine-rich protein YhjQ [bioreactor metagenome]|uniref:Putative cysteine-rich protein YhjQ n=1 Tax=bioreactor metagenome TaxID=1076179 RepID=A0A645F5K6_9ZZZZ
MGIVTNTTDKYQSCIDACNKCEQACYECFKACLNEADVAARKNCISILVECAQMCQMSSVEMAMDAQFAKEYCQMCATICDACAKECEMFKDDHCQKCAQECRACAEQCRMMAGM